MSEFPNPPRSRKAPNEQLDREENNFIESWGSTVKGAAIIFVTCLLTLLITFYLFDACGDSTKPRQQYYAIH
jgi:hypothetical protein